MILDFSAAWKNKFVTIKLSIVVDSPMKLIEINQIEPLLWDMLVCFVNGNNCSSPIQFNRGRMRDNFARCPIVNNVKFADLIYIADSQMV